MKNLTIEKIDNTIASLEEAIGRLQDEREKIAIDWLKEHAIKPLLQNFEPEAIARMVVYGLQDLGQLADDKIARIESAVNEDRK